MKKRRGKTVAERMAVSLRREEAEATGKPLYMRTFRRGCTAKRPV